MPPSFRRRTTKRSGTTRSVCAEGVELAEKLMRTGDSESSLDKR
jgi:hypothetical protein